MSSQKNLIIIDHPLAQSKLWHLRNSETTPDNFRRLMAEVSEILAYEFTRELKTREVPVTTPFAATKGRKIDEAIALIPIMRAGQAMLDGMLNLLPFAAVGHIGIYRDKFVNNTVEYYFRVPKEVEKMRCLVMDPLMATGDTAIAAVARLKEYGVQKISFATLLVAKSGLEKFTTAHPDVPVYTLSVEPEINAQGYITPGIGDAGDRIYGTHGTDIEA